MTSSPCTRTLWLLLLTACLSLSARAQTADSLSITVDSTFYAPALRAYVVPQVRLAHYVHLARLFSEQADQLDRADTLLAMKNERLDLYAEALADLEYLYDGQQEVTAMWREAAEREARLRAVEARKNRLTKTLLVVGIPVAFAGGVALGIVAAN